MVIRFGPETGKIYTIPWTRIVKFRLSEKARETIIDSKIPKKTEE